MYHSRPISDRPLHTHTANQYTHRHAHHIAARAPVIAKVRALPIVGYFLDHPELSGGTPDYRATMQYVLSMQNITGSVAADASGALSPACLAAYSPTSEQWKCVMSPYAQAFVTTPFFMMNSKFDFWQLCCILDVGCLCPRNVSQTMSNQCAPGPSTCWSNPAPHNHSTRSTSSGSSGSSDSSGIELGAASPPIVGVNCNTTQRAAVRDYGTSFLSALAPVVAASDTRNGAFITSCICHACDWSKLTLNGKTANAHFSDWYYGRTTGIRARVVDPRGPNGGGALERSTKEPGWMNCSDGYYPNQVPRGSSMLTPTPAAPPTAFAYLKTVKYQFYAGR